MSIMTGVSPQACVVVAACLLAGFAAASEVNAADGVFGWRPVSYEALAAERAKGVADDFDLSATINGGFVQVDGTGTNIIDASSFAGAVGLINVIQNNGNNAIIQNGVAVEVNVFSGPPPG